jgi:hypothetical protein
LEQFIGLLLNTGLAEIAMEKFGAGALELQVPLVNVK